MVFPRMIPIHLDEITMPTYLLKKISTLDCLCQTKCIMVIFLKSFHTFSTVPPPKFTPRCMERGGGGGKQSQFVICEQKKNPSLLS